MLKRPLSLRVMFVLLIGIGIIVFLALIGLGTWLSYPTQTDTTQQPAHTEKRAEQPHNVPANIIGTIIMAAPSEAPPSGTKGADGAQKPEQKSFGFWDATVTDLALVFFTYCLVIVGWATMRSNESTLQEIERGRLFSGVEPSTIRNNGGLLAVGLSLQNHGRTTGFMKERGHKFFSAEPEGPVSYEGGEIETMDSAVEPQRGSGSGSREVMSPFAFIGVQYLAGYVRYVDIFGHEFVTRHCQKIETALAGPLDDKGVAQVRCTVTEVGADQWHSDERLR